MIDLSDPRIDFNNIIWIQNEWKMFNYGLAMLNYRDRIHMVNTITVKSNDLSFVHKRPSRVLYTRFPHTLYAIQSKNMKMYTINMKLLVTL